MGFFDSIFKKKKSKLKLTKQEKENKNLVVINDHKYYKNNEVFTFDKKYNFLKRYRFYRTLGFTLETHDFFRTDVKTGYINFVKNKITNCLYLKYFTNSFSEEINYSLYKTTDPIIISEVDKYFNNTELFHDEQSCEELREFISKNSNKLEKIDENNKKLANLFNIVEEYMVNYYLDFANSRTISKIATGKNLSDVTIVRSKINKKYYIYSDVINKIFIIDTNGLYINFFENLINNMDEYCNHDSLLRHIEIYKKDFNVIVIDDVDHFYLYAHSFIYTINSMSNEIMRKRINERIEKFHKNEARKREEERRKSLAMRSKADMNTI